MSTSGPLSDDGGHLRFLTTESVTDPERYVPEPFSRHRLYTPVVIEWSPEGGRVSTPEPLFGLGPKSFGAYTRPGFSPPGQPTMTKTIVKNHRRRRASRDQGRSRTRLGVFSRNIHPCHSVRHMIVRRLLVDEVTSCRRRSLTGSTRSSLPHLDLEELVLMVAPTLSCLVSTHSDP